MERFSIGPDVARTPAEEILEGVTVAPLTPPLAAGSPIQCAVFRLAAGGRIGRHPASVPQVLAVVEGAGTVSGADGVESEIAAGGAVFWAAGEVHETCTEVGLTAVVLEGAEIRPFLRRAEA